MSQCIPWFEHDGINAEEYKGASPNSFKWIPIVGVLDFWIRD